MIQPPFLKPGDTIAIAATARKISIEELRPAIHLLESWGLKVFLPEQVLATNHQFAGTDDTRAFVFQQLLDNPDIKAIFCARGGYGTVRMIDKLDFTYFSSHPKWIIGYSDVTVLHSHIHSRLNIPTIHATMPINIVQDERLEVHTETLRKTIFGEQIIYSEPSHPLNRPGICHGQLVGGNLSILYSLCGSISSINTIGKILFIEDLDEYLYHIDRMMINLKRNGLLSNLAGLLVGRFTDMHDNAIPFGSTAEEIILDAVKEYDYPVAFNFPSGHNGAQNHALILGHLATMSVGRETELSFPQ